MKSPKQRIEEGIEDALREIVNDDLLAVLNGMQEELNPHEMIQHGELAWDFIEKLEHEITGRIDAKDSPSAAWVANALRGFLNTPVVFMNSQALTQR